MRYLQVVGRGFTLGMLLSCIAAAHQVQAADGIETKDAAAQSDGAALMLADQSPMTQDKARDWQFSLEAAAGETRQRYGKDDLQNQRLSFDFQLDKKLGQNWSAVLSDQLDLRWQHLFEEKTTINTLKEAYFSWQPQPEWAFDFGRINARNGVAFGYNPTDYFRSGANRSIVAIDPISLKKNRQGSVMLRGQTLWSSGSLTTVISPRLEDKPDAAAFSLDFGATNRQDRWLLALSQQLSEDLNPQWLMYGQAQQSPQLGFNLTTLWGQATVGFLEWSGGRSASQLVQALQGLDDTAFRSRLATGLTYTTDNKVSLTVEYDFNGAAPTAQAWDVLSQRGPLAYGQYRQWVQDKFDLPTRQSALLYVSRQDALLNHLDISAMRRLNLDDHSHLTWLEARYHWSHSDMALQWQHNSGKPGSEFGALQQQHVVQVLWRYFF
jgi:hypothetical protein